MKKWFLLCLLKILVTVNYKNKQFIYCDKIDSTNKNAKVYLNNMFFYIMRKSKK